VERNADPNRWRRRSLALLAAAVLTLGAPGGAAVRAQSGSGPWAPATFMQHERSESSIADLDGRMYVIGGYPGDRFPSDVVQVWDSRTDTWSEGPPVPMPLHHASAVSVNGKIYLLGGEFDGAGTNRPAIFLDAVYELDPEVGVWLPLAPMPSARSGSAAVVLDGKIYVIGGRPPAGPEFEMYDPATDTWTVLPNMPTPRNHIAAGVIDGKIYVVGGRFGGGFDSELTDILEVYDPATRTWSRGPSAPTIRSGMSFAVIGSCLYIFGGERNRADPRGVFPQTEAFDARTGTWYELTPMPTPVHGQIGAALFNGRIHTAGGSLTYGTASASMLHQIYTPERSCT
jgi:N-acetylneuraminic acid mutarotase